MYRTRVHSRSTGRPTRDDVAKQANISGATVSRVLSGRTDLAISPETRAKVLEAAGFTVDKVYLAGFPFFNVYRCMVIARGSKLATDVESGQGGASSHLASAMMAMFRGLFALNIHGVPLGWQVVAVARKKG